MNWLKSKVLKWLGVDVRLEGLEAQCYSAANEIKYLLSELKLANQKIDPILIGVSEIPTLRVKREYPTPSVASVAAWKTAIRKLPGYNEQQEADYGQGIQEIQQGIQAGPGARSEVPADVAGPEERQEVNPGVSGPGSLTSAEEIAYGYSYIQNASYGYAGKARDEFTPNPKDIAAGKYPSNGNK